MKLLVSFLKGVLSAIAFIVSTVINAALTLGAILLRLVWKYL